MRITQQAYGIDRSSSRITLTIATILISLVFSVSTAFAGSPPAPVGCPASSATFENTTSQPIEDSTTTTSTITVSGMYTYLWDVDLTTYIKHTWCDDLEITLTSPAGTVVTITTDNGDDWNDLFDGTLWDDDAGDTNAPGAVTEFGFSASGTVTPLCPEEAMGAFIGEDPNGVWTLNVYDDGNGNQGSLNGWSLDLTTLSHVPAKTTTSFSRSPNLPIPDNGTTTRTINVSGLDTLISDVNLWTKIQHTCCNNLDITLTSPAGTVVTITTDNGFNFGNLFDGTLWDDDAGDTNGPGAVTDISFADNVAETPLCPEEAMAAFIGEDPNGMWTLTITDDQAGGTGTLSVWTLEITTCAYPDSDADGVPDTCDRCPFDNPDDSDGDNVCDSDDNCPNDPDKLDLGACGCGMADTDTDGDGVADCVDNCPNDANKLDPGACGCGVADTDTDGDGVADCDDNCPNDANKLDPGICGCGVADTDSDGDGIPDCFDTDPSDDQENPGDTGAFAFCGLGTAACIPLMIAGLGLMRHRVRRQRRKWPC